MASKRTAKVGDAASAARNNPYVQRIIEDDDLRENLRDAYERSRSAYGRLSNGKAPTKALMEDKKLQKELREAVEDLRSAAERLQGKAPKAKKRGRKLLLLVLGLGALFNPVTGPETRRKLKELVTGGGDEFGSDASSNGG
jgi:hypothetical protein